MKYNTTLVVGKTKTGKTRNILFNELKEKINNKDNLVILDSKKEYFNHFYDELNSNGYDIKVINLSDPLKSNGWNPLSYISFIYRENPDKAIELLEKMAKNIFYEKNPNNDPFWEEMASQLFIGLALLLIRLSKNIRGSRIIAFSSISVLLSVGESKGDDNKTLLRKYVETLNPTDPIYIALSSIVFAPTDTKGSIMAVFKVKMNQYLMRENLVTSFINNEVSESKLDTASPKIALFIIGTPSLNRLTNIFIEQCFNEAISTNNNITMILDGYDTLPPLYDINNMIFKANNSNVSLYLTSTEKLNLKDIERTIETTDTFETEIFDKDVELPELLSDSKYEEDFSIVVKENLLKLINKD